MPKTVAKVGAAVIDKFSGGDAFIKPFMVDMADDHYALDISRAKQMLGWEPEHNLREVLPTILGHLQQEPAEWYRQNGLDPSDIQ